MCVGCRKWKEENNETKMENIKNDSLFGYYTMKYKKKSEEK